MINETLSSKNSKSKENFLGISTSSLSKLKSTNHGAFKVQELAEKIKAI